MNLVDQYFKDKVKNLNFIELKDYVDLKFKMDDGESNIPLPIVSDVLAEGISKGEMKEEITAESILDGMIYMVAADPKSELGEKYMEILRAYDRAMDDYIFFKGIKFLDKGKEERAEVYFRALRFVYPKHVLGLFNYGLALERRAQKLFNEEKEKGGMEFLKASTYEFESILDIDEKYALAYYKLGYHYRFANQFLKAKLMWEKYIKLDNDDLRKQEIREQIEIIDDDVLLESGLTYLSYNRHEEALDCFLKIKPRHSEWWEIYYLTGIAYAGLGEGDRAIEEYRIALSLNSEIEDVYNELGIELFKRGEIADAVDVYTDGIEQLGEVYKFYFNRGLGFIQLGLVEEGLKDVKKAYELKPNDPNIKETLDQLEESLNA